MKKNYSKYLEKTSRRTIAYILLSVVSASILFYSCRKVAEAPSYHYNNKPPIDLKAVITDNDLTNWYNDLPIIDQNNLNAVIGLTGGNGKLPFQLRWDKAQQRIINGKHVVRMPAGPNAAIVFEKEGNNGPLSSYVYKWQDNTNKTGELYSGRVLRFSFQDYSVLGQIIKDNKQTASMKFPVKGGPFTTDQINNLKQELKKRQVATSLGNSRLRTQGIGDILNSILTAVVKTVEAVGCIVTNKPVEWGYGTLKFFPSGGAGSGNGKGYMALSCDGDEKIINFSANPDSLATGDDTQGNVSGGGAFLSLGLTSLNGGSSGGGSSSGGSSSGGSSSGGSSGSGGSAYSPWANLGHDLWSQVIYFTGGNYTVVSPTTPSAPPPPTGITSTEASAIVSLLQPLTSNQQGFITATSNSWMPEIRDYLGANPTMDQKTLAKLHIDMLQGAYAGSYGYSQLAVDYERYRYSLSLTKPNLPFMWWQNGAWVNNPTNNERALPYLTALGLDSEFGYLDAPIDVTDTYVAPVFFNLDASLTDPFVGGRMIAASSDRRPTPPALPEDLTYGTNGDVTGVNASELTLSDDDLFAKMFYLIDQCTSSDYDMRAVAYKMIYKFRGNTGGVFSDPVLSAKVQENKNYKDYVQYVAAQINNALKNANGDLSQVQTIALAQRPHFNGPYNKFHGLMILMDDTMYSEIKIGNYEHNGNQWAATIDVTIYDDFGLDKADVLKYQTFLGLNTGFADWWILQHKRNYKPFGTVVHLRQNLSGYFN